MAVSRGFQPSTSPRAFFRKTIRAKARNLKTWRPFRRVFSFSRRTYVQSLTLSTTAGFTETEQHLHNPQSLRFSNPGITGAQFDNVVVS